MTLLKVSCQSCGAPLDVSDDMRFITCGFCSARLEVVRDANYTVTRIMEEVRAVADRLDRHLEIAELREQIENLDLGWRDYCKRNFGSDENGRPHRGPNNGFAVGLVFLTILMIVIPIVDSMMSLGMRVTIFISGIGLLILSRYVWIKRRKEFEVFEFSVFEYQQKRALLEKSLLTAQRHAV